MADTERVVGAFAARREWRQAAALLDRMQPLTPAGQYLVRVGLVADVPDQAVVRGVVDIMQRNSQLHRAQSGREMSAAGTDGLNQEFPQLRRERGQVSLGYSAQVRRGFYGTQQRVGRGALSHGDP